MKPAKKPGEKSYSTTLIGVAALVGLFVYFWNAQSDERFQKERLASQIANMEETRKKNAVDYEKRKKSQIPTGIPVKSGSPGKKVLNEFGADGRPKDPLVLRSQAAIDNFSKISGLKMKLVPGMNFTEMDFDDDIGALVGKDTLRGIEFGLYAKRGVVSDIELKAFLAQDTAGIPGLEGMPSVALGEAQNLSATQGSGLGDVKYWQITNAKKTVTIALIPRADGQGTYFAALSTSSPDFDSAEEFYTTIYSGIKVSR